MSISRRSRRWRALSQSTFLASLGVSLGVSLGASLAACSLSADPVDELLEAPASGTPEDASSPTGRLAALDQACQEALAATRAKPDDIELLLTASRKLFDAADLRLQLAALAALLAEPAAGLDAVLRVDERLDAATQAAILSLATEGQSLAERAIALRDDRVEGHLRRGLHLSLVAWANGPTRSLFAGFGPQIVAAIDRAVAIDATHDGGAPLRLLGRFRSKAPWPYGDLDAARDALLRASELAPVPVTLLFLGDLHHARGERELALAAWQRASVAEADPGTGSSAEEIRELARKRLEAASRAPAG